MERTSRYTTTTSSRCHSILGEDARCVQKLPNFEFHLLPDLELSRVIVRNLAHMFFGMNLICLPSFMVNDAVVLEISPVSLKWCVHAIISRPVWNLHLGHSLKHHFGNPRYRPCGASFLLKIGREVPNSTVNNLIPSNQKSDNSNLREKLAKFGG